MKKTSAFLNEPTVEELLNSTESILADERPAVYQVLYRHAADMGAPAGPWTLKWSGRDLREARCIARAVYALQWREVMIAVED